MAKLQLLTALGWQTFAPMDDCLASVKSASSKDEQCLVVSGTCSSFHADVSAEKVFLNID